jgi:hypothetical protein
MLLRRCLPDVITDPVDYIASSIGIVDDTAQRFPDLAQVWRLLVKEIDSGIGVIAGAADRLLDFVSSEAASSPKVLTRLICARSDS